MNNYTESDEHYKKIGKKINIKFSDSPSNEDSEDNKHSSTQERAISSAYDKLLNLCRKAHIDIYEGPSKKTKTYEQLLKACNTKKRNILKEYIVEIAPYGTKKGYENLAGTYIIESMADNMISKLHLIDTIIKMLEKVMNPKKMNILTLLNIKNTGKKKKHKVILEEYETI